MYGLEDFDPVGQTTTKAPVLRGRVVAPRPERLGADSPEDALAICMDEVGRVELSEVARLLGTEEPEARVALGTLVYDDPETGRLVPSPTGHRPFKPLAAPHPGPRPTERLA